MIPRSRSELAALLALAVFAVLPLAVALVQAGRTGGVWIGGDGLDVQDVFQYLAWVREASEHVLAATKFDLVEYERVFVEPLFLASGALHAAGLGLGLSYALWKPVAVVVLFAGCVALARRFLPEGGAARTAAVVLALLSYPAVIVLCERLGVGGPRALFELDLLKAETFLAGSLWGAYPIAISVGLMAFFVLRLEPLLDSARRGAGRRPGRSVAVCAATGFLVTWLHPWQGATLLVLLAGLAIWMRLGSRELGLLAGPAAATLAPALYYLVLSRTDAAWEGVTEAVSFPLLTWWILPAVLAPLALPAIAVLRVRPPAGVAERALALWPLAALAVYFAAPSYRFHALLGISIPLAILATRWWTARPRPRTLAAAAIAALTVPGIQALDELRDLARDRPLALYVEAGEKAALDYLEGSERPGGVLSPLYLGETVPALTGRNTWIGHAGWVADFLGRVGAAEELFAGNMGPPAARRFVRETGAVYLLSDCKGRADLASALGPLLLRERRFGCATVYELAEYGQPKLTAAAR